MTALGIFWWVIFPYVCLTLLVAGSVWRWRTDQFGWTSRTSTLHEHKLLRWGSPLFHYGILFVAAGHVLGLLIPKSWTEAVGMPQTFYHLMATVAGVSAGTATVIGLLLLKHIYGLSDEGVCERWVHDPYFQYFTGEEFFQHKLPLDRSSMTRWTSSMHMSCRA